MDAAGLLGFGRRSVVLRVARHREDVIAAVALEPVERAVLRHRIQEEHAVAMATRTKLRLRCVSVSRGHDCKVAGEQGMYQS